MKKIKFIVISILILFTLFGLTSKLYNKLIYQAMSNEVVEYTQDSYEKSRNTFLGLTALKAGLDVIEGSSLNLAVVNVEVGDVVGPVYDIVNILWKVTLVASVIYKVKLLFFTSLNVELFDAILLFSLICYLTALCLNEVRSNKIRKYSERIKVVMYKSFRILISSLLFIFLFIPLVIIFASKTTEAIDTNYRQVAYTNLNESIETLNTKQAAVIDFEEKPSILKADATYKEFKDDLESFTKTASETTNVASDALPTIIGVTILIEFVIPLFLIFIIYKLFMLFMSEIYNHAMDIKSEIIVESTELKQVTE